MLFYFVGLLYDPKEVVVVVEKVPVCAFKEVMRALLYSFCSYYVLNISYHEKIVALLEFIQR